MTASDAPPPMFRLAYVPGVTPSKWVRIWQERLPEVPLELVPVAAAAAAGVLREGGADAGLLRLPVGGTDLSAIPLYTETTVVVVPKDHVVAAVDEVSAQDLADELLLHPLDDTLGWERPPGHPANERPATTADAVELVAAGVGLVVVPQSLARLHHRRDLTYRPVSGTPESRIALSWPQDATTELVEQFIGIVRGRTVNSTRGPQAAAAAGGKPAARTGATAGRPTAKGASKAGGKGTAKGAGKGTARGGGKAAPKGGATRGKPRRRS